MRIVEHPIIRLKGQHTVEADGVQRAATFEDGGITIQLAEGIGQGRFPD
jgi:hypothetical protein